MPLYHARSLSLQRGSGVFVATLSLASKYIYPCSYPGSKRWRTAFCIGYFFSRSNQILPVIVQYLQRIDSLVGHNSLKLGNNNMKTLYFYLVAVKLENQTFLKYIFKKRILKPLRLVN